MREQPAIFSKTHALVLPEIVTSEKIQQALTLYVEEIRDWANGNGYLVGHITQVWRKNFPVLDVARL